MATFRQKLGDIRIPRRAGLALMASAAVLPVGLSAVGELCAAQTSAWFGLPLVLLGALAWHGNGKRAAGVSRRQARRIAGQRAFVVAAFSTLLGSVLVSNWPREAAIRGSIALNQGVLHHEAVSVRKSVFGHISRYQFFNSSLNPYFNPYGSQPDLLNPNDIVCESFARHETIVEYNHKFRVGFVQPTFVQINENGTISFYTEQTNGKGDVISRRLIYEEKEPSGE